MENFSCPRCNWVNKKKAKFCSKCGISFKELPQISQTDNRIINDRYRIIKTIKAGGMGMVYLAEDIPKQKLRAIKVMFNQGEASQQQLYAIKRFREEAEILARLDHPNIPGITDYFTDQGNYYLVMDYIKGEDLDTFLKKCKLQIPEKFVVLWGIQLCDVLSYLHNNKPHAILYRDLKPANIILNKEESRIFLIDFGIARAINPAVSAPKTAVGTEGYAPIEQYKGKGEERSDIYALGATMHHLLTGKTPIPFTFEPITKIRDWHSKSLEQIVMKALEYEIDNRYSNAEEMKKELLDFCKTTYPDMYNIAIKPLPAEKAASISELRQSHPTQALPQKPPRPHPGGGHQQIPHHQQIYYPQNPQVTYPHYTQGVYPTYGQPYGQIPYPYGQPPYGYPPGYPQVSQQPINIMTQHTQNPFSPYSDNTSSQFTQQPDIIESVKTENTSKKIIKEPKDEIEKLINMLKGDNDIEKSNASGEIIQKNLQDPRLIEPLIEALDEWDWNIRKESALSLGRLKSKKSVIPLIKKLNDVQIPVKINVIESLGKIGDKKATEPLLNLLKVEIDDGVKRQIIIALGEIRDDNAIPNIIEALKDENSGVRMAAAESLGNFRSARVMDPLQKATKDKSLAVATAAKKSIEKLKIIM